MHTRSLKAVAEFHKAFRLRVAPEPDLPIAPARTDELAKRMKQLGEHLNFAAEKEYGDILLLRLQLLQEELAELAEGMVDGDPVACLDALVDLQYVLDGTVLALGMQDVMEEAFEEVHRSNMSKLDHRGEPIFSNSGRVKKSDRYRPPNLRRLLSS